MSYTILEHNESLFALSEVKSVSVSVVVSDCCMFVSFHFLSYVTGLFSPVWFKVDLKSTSYVALFFKIFLPIFFTGLRRKVRFLKCNIIIISIKYIINISIKYTAFYDLWDCANLFFSFGSTGFHHALVTLLFIGIGLSRMYNI